MRKWTYLVAALLVGGATTVNKVCCAYRVVAR